MSYLEKSALRLVGTRPIRPDGVDKVTGRANFGADMTLPGMLWGKVKRSPHAHARIVSIDCDKALKLPGVRVVVTRADFLDVPPERAHIGAAPHNLRDLSLNCMAKGKVLYEGHAVAAVAATSPAIAEQALDLIEVDYEVLPHVMDVEAAMAPDAPLLHDDIFTAGIEPKPTKPSNITKMVRFAKGDVEAGFKEADIIIERRYTTKPVHQGYIEPHACVVSVGADGQCTIFSSSQGQFMVRAYTSRICGADIASIRAIPAEIGGGFGGKTIIYLEPLAYMLSKKSGRPVKMVMSREEVFRATGPTSGAVVEVKLGAKKDGHITAARTVLKYQAGAFPGSPVQQGCICSLAVYDLPNAETIGYDVLCNRAKVAAYRAPGAPIGSFAVESCVDELAHALKIDPLKIREINGAKEGTKATHGPTWVNIGYQKTLEAAKASEHLRTPLGPNQGRGIASGYWHNAGGGPSSAEVQLNAQGQGPGFTTHICDVEVDRETGYVKILRYTAIQDVGRAIHPSYVEGQMQGGVAQGIGWALNEEYVYDKDGRLENPGFLDYRVPVASDMPMIDTIMIEVPNPRHPFGARGVGEVPIVPPMAAVANAIADATGIRMRDLPMSPPKIRAALDAEYPARAAAE